MRDAAASIRGISLQQTLPEAEFIGAADLRVTSCCADSRTCRPGDLFVAIAGEHTDGHSYVRQAAQNGAAAVLADRPLPTDCGLPACYVADVRAAYGRLCQALAGHPARRLPWSASPAPTARQRRAI